MKRTFISILVLASILITSCGNNSSATPGVDLSASPSLPKMISAEGTLLPSRSAELAFAQGGVVQNILAQEGERIAEGEVILQLIGVETAQAELSAAKLEQILAQQALDELHRNALLTSSQTEQVLIDAQQAYEDEANGWNLGNKEEATDLELSIDDYVSAEEDCRNARTKLDEVLYLDPDDRDRMDAQEDFDTEKASFAAAYSDLKDTVAKNNKSLDEELIRLLSAISNLETARELASRLDDSSLDPEILAIAEARLETANAQAAAADAATKLYEMRAPFSGTLLRLDVNAGEVALPMMPVAFVADTTQWIIETKDLPEVDIAQISTGDSVTVQLDAFPREEFAGTVSKINPVGKLYLGDMTYQITIALDKPDSRFLWNMTAVISINTTNE